MPFDLTVTKGAAPSSHNPNDAKKRRLEELKAAASAGKEPTAIVRYIPPAECSERIRIEFDDSGSMGSYIEDAKKGVVEFLRNCVPNQTAVAVHFMNTKSWSTSLRSDLPQLGSDIQESQLHSGGTPFFNTMKQMLEATPTLTRLVAFTDGSPTDALSPETSNELQTNWSTHSNWMTSADVIIKLAKVTAGKGEIVQGKCIPIDTVFFGAGYKWEDAAMDLLRYLSKATGGYFLHFDPAKVNFRTAFKYLAPVNRLMLTSPAFRANLESGRQK